MNFSLFTKYSEIYYNNLSKDWCGRGILQLKTKEFQSRNAET